MFSLIPQIELIHIKGGRCFNDRALLAKVYATNQLVAWFIKRNVRRVYFEPFNKLFLIYEKPSIADRFKKLRDIVGQFFGKPLARGYGT